MRVFSDSLQYKTESLKSIVHLQIDQIMHVLKSTEIDISQGTICFEKIKPTDNKYDNALQWTFTCL